MHMYTHTCTELTSIFKKPFLKGHLHKQEIDAYQWREAGVAMDSSVEVTCKGDEGRGQ